MDALFGVSLTIRISVSDDIFDANTDVVHKHEEDSGDNVKNDESRAFTSYTPCAARFKESTTTLKTSIPI